MVTLFLLPNFTSPTLSFRLPIVSLSWPYSYYSSSIRGKEPLFVDLVVTPSAFPLTSMYTKP